MSKVLVAFYNGIEDEDDENALPIFYESLVKGLHNEENDVAIFSHKFFGVDFPKIDLETETIIKEFNPDICIIFNNCFFDLSDVINCPIVIWRVDSPQYYANKNCIKSNPERYIHFILSEDVQKILMRDFGVSEHDIFLVPSFTEVHSDHSVDIVRNISFIGTKFLISHPFQSFYSSNPSEEEQKVFKMCVNEIRQNPQVSPVYLVQKYKIKSKLVRNHLDIPNILMSLSTEKRMDVLNAVAGLGLDLYGSRNWLSEYSCHIDLNFSYVDKKVYSLAHNQKIYNCCKIGINVSHLQATVGFPWRVMDIMASNACLVSDYHEGFERFFPEISNLLPVYYHPYEAYDVCKRLLTDESLRKEIVIRCNAVIEDKYRFKHLLVKMEEYSGVPLRKR